MGDHDLSLMVSTWTVTLGNGCKSYCEAVFFPVMRKAYGQVDSQTTVLVVNQDSCCFIIAVGKKIPVLTMIDQLINCH